MNKYSTLLVNNLLEKSEQKVYLKLLEKLFVTGIPFNIPHKLRFLELTESKTRLLLPYIRYNKNHLGGIHACATATVGEFPAGLTLVKHFGSSQYRIILEELHINYIRQAREDLVGEVIIDQLDLNRLKEELLNSGASKIKLITNVMTIHDEITAVVQSSWQMKDWREVKYKSD